MVGPVILFALSITVIAAAKATVTNGFHGYQVLSAQIPSRRQLAFLINFKTMIENSGSSDEIDFWNEPTDAVFRSGTPLLILVSPAILGEVEETFRQEGIMFDVAISDVARALEEENPGTALKIGDVPKLSWTIYHNYATIENYITELAKMFPNLAKLETIGISYEGRNLYLLKISTPHPEGLTKPAIWLDASMIFTPVNGINRLTAEYSTNSTSKKLVDRLDWYFVPVVNPDGFDYTHQSTDNRMWRRTRKVNPFSTCIGADPNRNHDHNWMYDGANQNPCGDLYAGAHPFSEVEDLFVTDAIFERKEHIKAFVGLHSFSQLWLVPWGHNNSYPDDIAGMRALADRGMAALKRQHGTDYRFGTPSETLGKAGAGGTMDWTKAKANIKYSLTLELRDKGRYGFILPANQIIPTARETFEAIIEIAKTVYLEFKPT